MNARIGLAALLALGYISLIALAMFAPIADTAQRIVDGGLGALGVALGNAVAGIFRTDQADEQRARNTGAALSTIGAAINATPPGTQQVEVVNDPDSPVPTETVK